MDEVLYDQGIKTSENGPENIAHIRVVGHMMR